MTMLSRLTDTLAKRLFLLMWGALVASHLLAWGTVQLVYLKGMAGGPSVVNLPTFPSLPPTPGLPDARRQPRPPEDANRPPPPPMREPGGQPPGPSRRGGSPGLPINVLLLDYGVRLAVIALAAWWGSRWLAAPMRGLVNASQSLGRALNESAPPAPLDEQQGTREVRETAKVFNTMASQLHRQFRSRGLMVAAISHDLRTPLTRLRMRLEMMDEQPLLQAKSVADVQEMNALIDKVLEVFRDRAQAEPVQKTDIAALLNSLVDDLTEQGHELTFDGPAELIALAQPDALRRVFGNLLGNALRYGGRADVQLQLTGSDTICIHIDDTGPGIPPAQLEAVFEPFYRLDASRSKDAGGTGLGLYIARELLSAQGSTLTLRNRPDGGLRAQVLLPVRMRT